MPETVGRRRSARVVGAAVLVPALAVVSGCSQSASAAPPKRVLVPLAGHGAPGSGRAAAPVGPPTLTLQPAADAANVSPTVPITVAAGNATIDAVSLTDQQGKQVAGALDQDK